MRNESVQRTATFLLTPPVSPLLGTTDSAGVLRGKSGARVPSVIDRPPAAARRDQLAETAQLF
jgi:hypothetical protein